ncbi:MAG TPA: hypothetical protein VM779_06610, partial [Thermoanaerobaculia bacterium]|nr:hypothetical protein [Thermoanaerobaculia bacterium]
MQRRLHLLTLLLWIAAPAFAGISYDFTSATTGLSNQTVTGTVRADGSSLRMDVGTGDGVLFQSGSFVVSTNGAQTMTVVDPRAKTFYQIDLSQMLGGAGSLQQQLGSDITIEVRDPRVSVSAAADAGSLEGFKVRKSAVRTAYEIAVSAFGQPVTVQIQVDSDVWWTDQISTDFTNFLQMRGLRTGLDAVDKLLATEAAQIKGFPLKQVTTTRFSFGG